MSTNLFLLKQKTVLYIEDEPVTREQTTAILTLLFKNVFVAKSAEEGISIFDEEKIDIILADIGLPQKDGLYLVKTIRSENYHIPIVMLTSKTAQEQVLQAANLAIDGYIIKPFDLNNLIKVLSNALQRNSVGSQIADFGNGTIFNLSTQEMSVNGEIIPLGKKERELLSILVEACDRTVSPEDITAKLWPMEDSCDSALKNLVMRLRKKIGEDLILSVKSAGYRANLLH